MPPLLLSALIGDAIALGPHWIYKNEVIQNHFPNGLTGYEAPRSLYHPGKNAGDQTHYGDQTLALASSLQSRGDSWSMDGWRQDWRAYWQTSDSYRDHATRETLAHMEQGSNEPSDSNELGGATRIAAVCSAIPANQLERRIQLARKSVALTHGDPVVADAAEWLVRIATLVEQGRELSAAIREAESQAGDVLNTADIVKSASDFAQASVSNDVQALLPLAIQLGLSCDMSGALPLALGLAVRLENDPPKALITNALLGGDSAARGLIIGLLLGARHGVKAWPETWLDGLNAVDAISS